MTLTEVLITNSTTMQVIYCFQLIQAMQALKRTPALQYNFMPQY